MLRAPRTVCSARPALFRDPLFECHIWDKCPTLAIRCMARLLTAHNRLARKIGITTHRQLPQFLCQVLHIACHPPGPKRGIGGFTSLPSAFELSVGAPQVRRLPPSCDSSHAAKQRPSREAHIHPSDSNSLAHASPRPVLPLLSRTIARLLFHRFVSRHTKRSRARGRSLLRCCRYFP